MAAFTVQTAGIIRISPPPQWSDSLTLSGNDSCHLSYTVDGQVVTVAVTKSETTLGRDATCDLVIPDHCKGTSRRHARLMCQGGSWTISDLGSVNGTFVNDVRVSSASPLKDHDVISLGPMTMRFHLGAASLSAGEQVQFDEESDSGAQAAAVSMSDFDQILGFRMSPSAPPAKPRPQVRTTELVPLRALSEPPPPVKPRGELGTMGLFRQVAQALLSTQNLDEMLERVMDLVFKNLPAERGSLCLYDSESGKLAPRVARVKVGKPDDTITISRSIVNEVIKSKNSVLVRDAAADERFREAVSLRQEGIHSAMCAPLYNEGRVVGLIYVDTLSLTEPFTKEHLEVLATLAILSALGVEQARLREDIVQEQNIRRGLSRYSSPAVVDQIINGAEGVWSGMTAQEKEVSVVFGDLSGFTSLSEDMAPAEVARTLNEIFEFLTDAIFRNEGTLDKYRGDGLMAVFGAPLPQADHAERAIRTALVMQQQLDAFNRAHADRKPMRIRIGINSGPVVAGDIGSPRRRDYTVIGDTVNVASRLESSVAEPGQVVIGPLTFKQAGAKFNCRPLPPVQLKGKQRLVQPYVVLGTN